MKPLLIFRHISVEGPGYFGQLLERLKIPYQIIAVDESDPVPDRLENTSGLVFMGGPMSVNDSLPWISQELNLIREAVDRQIPVLGHCFGGQLISKALGGTVSANKVKEIGWHAVQAVQNEATKDWLDRLPAQFTAFHWHGETFSLPEGARTLLSNEHCDNQAFVLGNTLALQCHVEITAVMVHEWVELYADELQHTTESVQDPGAITARAEEACRELQKHANVLYERWLQGLKK